MEYWQDHPPAHVVLAAAYLKQSRRKMPKKSDAADDLNEFSRALGITGIIGPLPAVYRDK